jgi:S1-C subfamily serine protease
VRPRDVLLELGGRVLASVSDLQRSLGAEAIGQRIRLALLRGNERIELAVQPIELARAPQG